METNGPRDLKLGLKNPRVSSLSSKMLPKIIFGKKKIYFRLNSSREHMKIFKMSLFRGGSDTYFSSNGRFQKPYGSGF